MKKMDEYAYVRSMMGLVILAYFLGNNLSIYITLFIAFTFYLIVLRVIRAWVKRWLLYLLEFCYYGCFTVVFYLMFFTHSRAAWSAAYMCATGVLTWAAFLFQNQARMDNSDQLIASWIHTFPMITVWAIRWKHMLYEVSVIEHIKYNLIDLSEVTYSNDTYFSYLIIFPLIIWATWAVFYYFISKFVWNYVVDPKYSSALIDFKNTAMKALGKVYGNHDNMLLEKYLISHLIFFVMVFPISLLSYYSFIFNTGFMVSTLVFISWNAGKASRKHMERMIKKLEEGMAKEK